MFKTFGIKQGRVQIKNNEPTSPKFYRAYQKLKTFKASHSLR